MKTFLVLLVLLVPSIAYCAPTPLESWSMGGGYSSSMTEEGGSPETVLSIPNPNPELQHYNWNANMTNGDCGYCHVAPGSFLPASFENNPGFCITCHNVGGTGHEKNLSGKYSHSLFANATASGRRRPSYGNITAGEYNNQPFSRLKDGHQIVCVTCHNAMQKPEDTGRTWELTTTTDNMIYTLQYGGWSASGYLVPNVYRDTGLWTGPTYSKSKKSYLVNPSEYTYNETAGTITFITAQSANVYIYVSLDYPYLRASSQDNRLCGDCHSEVTHKTYNCIVCHRAHNTDNLAGIREKIRTPNYSSVAVRFTAYTGAGSFADGDANHDGICEVCHTQTKYYRRDGNGFVNHSGRFNYNGTNCSSCHSHTEGFPRISFAVKIDSPFANFSTNEYSAMVKGTIIGRDNAEVGVTVNGMLAEVNGSSFVLADLPLSLGANFITAVATDVNGMTAKDSITINANEPTASPISISASPSSGPAPLAVALTITGTSSGTLGAGSIITTVAGNGNAGYSGDGGPAAQATLGAPFRCAIDASGNLFIADSDNNRIRKVDANGVITTVAGNGNAGYSGESGPATQAALNSPWTVNVDALGNLYIVDGGNNCVRKVDVNGIITTVAGNGNSGYSGDGGLATQASFATVYDVAVDTYGNIFIADLGNKRIRKVDTNGIISTIAGNGNSGYSGDGGPATQANIGSPICVYVDMQGNVYFEGDAFRLRKVDTNGIIATVAGNGNFGYSGDGGPATQASISEVYGLSVDMKGNLFMADMDYNCIRKVDTNGIITTVAGNGNWGYSGDGGPAVQAELGEPADVEVDASGNLYIVDMDNNCIRKVSVADVISGTNGAVNVTLYQLDYEGDGIIDATATTLDGLKNYLTHVYTNNGLYYPTIIVTDSAGKVYKKSTVVNVTAPPNLGGKWSGMKTALQSGDIASAANYFSTSTRESYRQQFQVFKDAGFLNETVSGMGDVVITKTLDETTAFGNMDSIIDGESYSFFVLFVKDNDGIWRIKSF